MYILYRAPGERTRAHTVSFRSVAARAHQLIFYNYTSSPIAHTHKRSKIAGCKVCVCVCSKTTTASAASTTTRCAARNHHHHMGARALKVSRTESYAAGRSAAAASRVPPPPPLTANIVASVRACVRMTNAERALTAKLDGVRGVNDADYLLALQQIRIEVRASRPTARSSGNVFIIYHTLTLLRNPRTHARTCVSQSFVGSDRPHAGLHLISQSPGQLAL